MCTATRADGHDLELIASRGFPIDRTMEDIHTLYYFLAEDVNGELVVKKSVGDEEYRTGLTSRPLTSLNLIFVLPPLHAKLRFQSMLIIVAYRYRSGVKKMGRGRGNMTTAAEKEAIQAAKLQIQAEARQLLHIKLDMPDPSGHGGSSDTGAVADKLFSNPEIFTQLFAPSVDDAPRIEDLLRRVDVVLAVLNCSRKVDTGKFHKYAMDTYLLLLEVFPWVSVSPSVHGALAHGAEAMDRNGGYGLGTKTEQGSEATNKLVRNTRQFGARKTSMADNLRDVWVKLFKRTDPLIRSHKRRLHCTLCDGDGHSYRCCFLREKKREVGR